MTFESVLPYLGVIAAVYLVHFMRQSAGRLAPRAAYLPIVFLITRWPVIFAWGVGAAVTFVVLVRDIRGNGRDPSEHPLAITALSLFCGLGAAVPMVGIPFFAQRAFAASNPIFPLEPRETILQEWEANHFLDGESRRGTLLLTTSRLGFRPQRWNVQLAIWVMPRADIAGTRTEGARFLLVDSRRASEVAWLVVRDPAQVAAAIAGATP